MDGRRLSIPRKPVPSSFLGIQTGRPRSNSQRSQRSQRSRGSLEAPEIDYGRRPSIRIRRVPSSQNLSQAAQQDTENGQLEVDRSGTGRSRSNSAPQRLYESVTPGVTNRTSYMPEISESSPTTSFPALPVPELVLPEDGAGTSQRPITPADSVRVDHARTVNRKPLPQTPVEEEDEYGTDVVDLLDIVDPEVATLSTLTNVQNSLFVPELGSWLNRRPTYTLTRRPTKASEEVRSTSGEATGSPKIDPRATIERADTRATLNTITSNVNDRYYAVLPHGVSLPGWSDADKQELNDHVRHMLHSKRSKFRRSMKGFGQYTKKPLGAFVTIYATLITLFGLAWVLFLIGWINVGGRQSYLINIIDNVLVALFAIIGDGLAPFRTVDTYHMCFIAHYHHLTWRLRKQKALPKLQNRNDLPSTLVTDVDEEEKQKEQELSVLTPLQQKRLAHHQKKFSRSHSFYKPHETTTHHAFPLRLLVAVVVLLDCHSLLQISLGTCTWAISYHHRPFALTTVILCCSITCNITAGILISVGDHKTRKKDIVEKMFRQELTAEAMDKLEKRREKERSRNKDLEVPGGVPPPLTHSENEPTEDTQTSR